MQEIILNSRPDGIPNTNSFKLVDWKPKELSIGEVLVEVQSFSLDPYMRGRMDDAKSYSAPVEPYVPGPLGICCYLCSR